jgi:hypothetical protein
MKSSSGNREPRVFHRYRGFRIITGFRLRNP